jgi:glycosyltransferase involved in cell wall biosynthesis
MSHQEKLPVSAVIITLNEEKALPKCLESVSFAAEIVVVDSGSTDRTIEIAEQYGAIVIHQEWLGYGKQKQFAVDQASHDWVYCLDADEWVSDELANSIQGVIPYPEYVAYESPRCNKFLGRWLRHGEGYPDYNLRLFNRKFARWSNDLVHEHVVCNGQVGRLAGDLMHESEDTLENYLSKQNRYTSLQAEVQANRCNKPSIIRTVFSPFVRFIKMYFVRLGFRDGFPGFVHISVGCLNSYIKNLKIYEKFHNSR